MDSIHPSEIKNEIVGILPTAPVGFSRFYYPEGINHSAHTHCFFEIGFVSRGTVLHRKNSEPDFYPLKTGSVYFIRPGDSHELKPAKGSEIINTYFLPEYLVSNLSVNNFTRFVQTLFFPALRSDITGIEDIALSDLHCEHTRALLNAGLFSSIPVSERPEYHIHIFNALLSVFSSALRESGAFSTKQTDERVTRFFISMEKAILDLTHPLSHKRCIPPEISEDTFNRIFKKETGQTPAEYALRRRIYRAIYLLRYSRESLTHIAQNLGFYDSAHFTKCFKKITKISPTAFIKKQRG